MLPSVYFFCCGERDNFQHEIVSLAEGLRELGVAYGASSDYWLTDPAGNGRLFSHTGDVNPWDCDVVVLPSNWFHWTRFDGRDFLPVVRRDMPDGLLGRKGGPLAVYMDSNDGFRTVSWGADFRGFDLILRSHFNRRCPSPSNMRPWQFGISGRMRAALGEAVPWSHREPTILVNFGASHGIDHSCRTASRRLLGLLPRPVLKADSRIDDLSIPPSGDWSRLMWEQTARRHSPAYYGRLRRARACACFCGELVPPMPFDPAPLLAGGNRAKLRRWFWEVARVLDSRPDRIIQWDSWRFWETLAAGAVAFHVDLEAHGVEMSVMPKNWEHYIGVDLRRPKAAIERIMDDPGCLERIGRQGRAWALQHYSPRAVAARFLKLLGFTAPSADIASDRVDGG